MEGNKQLEEVRDIGKLQVRRPAGSVAQCHRQTKTQTQVTSQQVYWEI